MGNEPLCMQEFVMRNPPYLGNMGMNESLQFKVKSEFPDSKTDLFAAFIDRGIKLLKQKGFLSMITQHAWMFLSSFEELRTRILENNIVTMAHLGPRAFDEIGGEVVLFSIEKLQEF